MTEVHAGAGYADTSAESWSSAKMAAQYSDRHFLYPPEATVHEILRPQLKDFAMLDLGVGAGRTASFFANEVAEYVGAD